jgi:hypothetical protein
MRALEKYIVPAPVHRRLLPLRVRHVSIIGRRPLQAASITKEPHKLTNPAGAFMLPLAPEFCRSAMPDTKLTCQQSCRTTQTLPWRTSIRDRACAACSRRRCSAHTVGILADHHFGLAGDVDAAEFSEEALVAIDAVDLERTSGEIDEGARARCVVQYDQWRKSSAAWTWTRSPRESVGRRHTNP